MFSHFIAIMLLLMLSLINYAYLEKKVTEGALYALLGIFPRTQLSGSCKFLTFPKIQNVLTLNLFLE